MHATPKSAIASTVAGDLAKDAFELAFADAHARAIRHPGPAPRTRVAQGAAHRGDQPHLGAAARVRCDRSARFCEGASCGARNARH
jgi:hypothetical protein